MTFNYKIAQEFCATNPAHPALLNKKDFENWCNALIVALKTPKSTPTPNPTPTTKPNPVPATNPNHIPATTANPKVIIYTDGACSSNPGRGGYAAILVCGEHTKEVSGGAEHTTNNRMELSAVIAALESLKKKSDVIIRSDSTYVTNNFKFVENWKNNNWRKKDKTPVVNIELWQRLSNLISERCISCTFEHVPGHAGYMLNEKCDKIAKNEIYKLTHPEAK